MLFKKLKIAGSCLIESNIFTDIRGTFIRASCFNELRKNNFANTLVQTNLCYTKLQRTIRGLHGQVKPYEEDKLIRCIKGSIFDVFVDLRPQSETYLQWHAEELSENNQRAIYIPKGCIHGYQTLTDDTIVLYQVSEFYNKNAEYGIRWDDPTISINWPFLENLTISEKDTHLPYIHLVKKREDHNNESTCF